jgi:post-segregation antitoxin (ccd killing protein)
VGSNREMIQAFVSGELSEADHELMAHHISTCQACAAAVAAERAVMRELGKMSATTDTPAEDAEVSGAGLASAPPRAVDPPVIPADIVVPSAPQASGIDPAPVEAGADMPSGVIQSGDLNVPQVPELQLDFILDRTSEGAGLLLEREPVREVALDQLPPAPVHSSRRSLAGAAREIAADSGVAVPDEKQSAAYADDVDVSAATAAGIADSVAHAAAAMASSISWEPEDEDVAEIGSIETDTVAVSAEQEPARSVDAPVSEEHEPALREEAVATEQEEPAEILEPVVAEEQEPAEILEPVVAEEQETAEIPEPVTTEQEPAEITEPVATEQEPAEVPEPVVAEEQEPAVVAEAVEPEGQAPPVFTPPVFTEVRIVEEEEPAEILDTSVVPEPEFQAIDAVIADEPEPVPLEQLALADEQDSERPVPVIDDSQAIPAHAADIAASTAAVPVEPSGAIGDEALEPGPLEAASMTHESVLEPLSETGTLEMTRSVAAPVSAPRRRRVWRWSAAAALLVVAVVAAYATTQLRSSTVASAAAAPDFAAAGDSELAWRITPSVLAPILDSAVYSRVLDVTFGEDTTADSIAGETAYDPFVGDTTPPPGTSASGASPPAARLRRAPPLPQIVSDSPAAAPARTPGTEPLPEVVTRNAPARTTVRGGAVVISGVPDVPRLLRTTTHRPRPNVIYVLREYDASAAEPAPRAGVNEYRWRDATGSRLYVLSGAVDGAALRAYARRLQAQFR